MPRRDGVAIAIAMAIAFAMAFATAACGKSDTATQAARDAAAPAPVPAPNSSLARELGADDAGRGVFRMYDDGPWCGFAPRVDRDKPLRGDLHESASTRTESPETSWLGFFETVTVPRDGPRVYDRAALALVLAGPKRAFPRQSVTLSLALVNDTAEPFHYGMPVDGSLEHWRGPFVDLYARDESSGRTYRWTFGKGFGRCGNVDPRKDDDYVIVPPKKRRADPFGEKSRRVLAPVFPIPGRYTLWVVYASSCLGTQIGSGSREDPAPPADLFDGTIASNGLTVEIVKEP